MLIAFLVIFPVSIFADDLQKALDESTALLQKANETIDRLTAENKRLKDDNVFKDKQILSLETSLAAASTALDQSNQVLQKAYDRIDKDSTEIKDLRDHIKSLISAGVEIRTYNWNVMISTGYPWNMGIEVAYNLPFFPTLGVMTGIEYNIDANIPMFKVGLKINIGKK